VRSQATVIALETQSRGIVVVLEGGERLEFDRAVVTAGAWTARLLNPFLRLPFTVTRQTYCHFIARSPEQEFQPDRFPVWIDFPSYFYGFPMDGVTPGVKVALHQTGRVTEADTVDREVHDSDRDPLRRYIAGRIPGLSADIVHEKVCLYTMSPDSDFVVDRLPGEPRVTVIGGLSGHGFKFTVLLGRAAAWLATHQAVPWDLSRFSLARLAQ
jgi:sarcosine oxidase